MATDLIRYDLLVQDALRTVVRNVLSDAAKNGLQGDHHFFITFRTTAPGLRLSNRMRARYPEEMTIILQHQFWDLGVTEHAFEVGLSFSNVPERLLIPFAAITSFADPSVEFGLKFDAREQPEPGPAEQEAAGPSDGKLALPAKRPLMAVEGSKGPEKPADKAPTPEPRPAGGKSRPTAVKTVQDTGPVVALGKKADAEKASTPDGEGKKVVSIDAFRKKP